MSAHPRVRLAQPMIGPDEQAAVSRVLESGSISQGAEVSHFEDEFSQIVDGGHCVAVNSGTSALHVMLIALGIGPGDEVVVPSFTFAATANAVRLCGAEPVFVDIEPTSFCMDPSAAAAAIGPRTTALLPVHLFGHPADMMALAQLAARHGLALLEDAAQAHAARIGERPVGSLGDGAAFSFYPTKNMTTGEGGMVVLADPAAVRRARLLRNQGMERPYENEIVGFNLRMTDISAAIGRVQLRRLEAMTELRRIHARMLNEGLAEAAVETPTEPPGFHHVYHQYTVRCRDRDALAARLESQGVESKVFYPIPVHRLPAFEVAEDLPLTTEATRTVLSLPVGPHLSEADIRRVIEAVGS